MNCPICAEIIRSNKFELEECKHVYHVKCIMQWFRSGHSSCPLCRYKPSKYLCYRDILARASTLRRKARGKKAPKALKSLVRQLQHQEMKYKQNTKTYLKFKRGKMVTKIIKKRRALSSKRWKTWDKINKLKKQIGLYEDNTIHVPIVKGTECNCNYN